MQLIRELVGAVKGDSGFFCVICGKWALNFCRIRKVHFCDKRCLDEYVYRTEGA
jgi:hypothetical protein